MIKDFEGPIPFTALECGSDLERGGVVGGHENAIRLRCGTEIVAPPAELAEFGKQLVETFGFNPAPDTRPQVLLVGRLSSGFLAYGFGPAHDAEGDFLDRMRYIEDEGSQEYVLMDVQPITDLDTLHGNDPVEPLKLGQPAKVVADVEVPGAGILAKGTSYFVWTRHGDKPGIGSAFAIIGREMIEAVDRLDDGTPDWVNGSIVDAGRGDEGFVHPAYALLRYMNTEWMGETSWCKADHDELTAALRRCRVESWTYDSGQDCYRVSVAADEEFVIRTPGDARAYVAGLHAIVAAK